MNRLLRGTMLAAVWLTVAVMLAACSGDSDGQGQVTDSGSAARPLTASAAKGQLVYSGTCVYCHGDGGKGIPNLGKDLTTSEFVAGQTDRQLIDFIKRGRMPNDPANTTGMPMPPNGGNAGLNDQDLANVVSYIRSLRQ